MVEWADAEKGASQEVHAGVTKAEHGHSAAAHVADQRAQSLRHQVRATAAAFAVTPVLLVPAWFNELGLRGLFTFRNPYPACNTSTLALPQILPGFMQRNLDCGHLLLMLALAIALYWGAVVNYFVCAYRRPSTNARGEPRNAPGIKRDLIIVTASCLLIAYAGSVRDPAVLILVICPLILDVHMALCVATDFAEGFL